MTLETPIPSPCRVDKREAAEQLSRQAAPLSEDLRRQILRFPKPARTPIRKLIRICPRAGDLAETFPGLLHVLACGELPSDAHLHAIDLLDDGAQLKVVARAVNLPMWVRRLPPEAFDRPLRQIPSSNNFTRRIGARLPVRAKDSAAWLDAVCFANRAAGEDFALWLARQRSACHDGNIVDRTAILAAYAWHACNPETPAHTLVLSHWRPEMMLQTAVCAAKYWFNRLMLHVYAPEGSIIDPWLEPAHIDGYDFVPLTSAAELLQESQAMSNCADQFGFPIFTNRCRLFSIRNGPRRLATLQIANHHREKNVLSIVQLKARFNAPAPIEVWQAAYRWMAAQSRLLDPQAMHLPSPLRPSGAIWQRQLSDYRDATGGAPWLPTEPTAAAIERLENGLAGLARDCGVRSWLFT